MKHIDSYDTALHYVNRLGFAGKDRSPGWIVRAQHDIAFVCDLLLKASGNKTWYFNTFTAFNVRLERYVADNGEYIPLLSTFYVTRFDDTIWKLKLSYDYPFHTLEQVSE